MTMHEEDNGWDDLVVELGLNPEPKPAPKSPEPQPKSSAPPRRPIVEPSPEHKGMEDSDDFGPGIQEEAPRAALYDPGPDVVAEDLDEQEEETSETFGEDSLEASESQDGGKRKRRRRRRKKKGTPASDVAMTPGTLDDDDAIVEQGEAPAEVEEEDDDFSSSPSLVEEELELEATQPPPEWQVMTWMELVSKLHRPG